MSVIARHTDALDISVAEPGEEFDPVQRTAAADIAPRFERDLAECAGRLDVGDRRLDDARHEIVGPDICCAAKEIHQTDAGKNSVMQRNARENSLAAWCLAHSAAYSRTPPSVRSCRTASRCSRP